MNRNRNNSHIFFIQSNTKFAKYGDYLVSPQQHFAASGGLRFVLHIPLILAEEDWVANFLLFPLPLPTGAEVTAIRGMWSRCFERQINRSSCSFPVQTLVFRETTGNGQYINNALCFRARGSILGDYFFLGVWHARFPNCSQPTSVYSICLVWPSYLSYVNLAMCVPALVHNPNQTASQCD